MTIPTMPDRLADVQPQMVRAGLRAQAKADRKKLADLRPVIGRLVERALELMGLSKQEAAYRLQYADAGTISRWCSATERPLFDKLFSLEGFEVAYVQAIAERNPAIAVDTVITIRRTAVG
jgi:hypothetical protein